MAFKSTTPRHSTPPAAWTWLPEILSALLSICLVAVIITTLKSYEGRPQPELPLGLTLNAVLQFVITATQFSFTFPLVQGLSQLKWLWFSPSDAAARPLGNFEMYDEACKGGLGSFNLLFGLRGSGIYNRLLTQLAAVLMISTVLSGPLTQQALTFGAASLSPVYNVTATLTRATSLSRTKDGVFQVEGDDVSSLQAVLAEVANLGLDRTITPLPPKCPTADCSWKPYGSLGVCATVTNLSAAADETALKVQQADTLSFIERTFNELNITSIIQTYPELKSGPSFPNYVIVVPSSKPLISHPESLLRAGSIELLLAFSASNMNMIDQEQREIYIRKFQFLSLLFYFCTKTFETRVAAGQPETREMDSAAQAVSSSATTLNAFWNRKMANFSLVDELCPPQVKGQTLVLASPPGLAEDDASAGTYIVDACTALAASKDVGESIAGAFIGFDNSTYIVNSGVFSYPLSLATHGIPAKPVPDHLTKLRNIQTMSTQLADTLTNMLREKASFYAGDAGGGSANTTVDGTAFALQAIIRVRWAWLTLIICQVILTTAVLALVICKTHMSGVEALKDSSIATLCVLDSDLRDELRRDSGSGGSIHAMKKRSRVVKARLERNGFEYQLRRVVAPVGKPNR
ncbi:hypothetical protein B0H66DRAFT_546552 [Apodospora peruviana]|uniref:Uncharacterized protein n=1 Tax=Apodospora peruviana TaxID=516989 RepID=A0AAE0IUL0_9PEZI|nr:hypothetical protein B0H66DRAFT_546552 [Apodospora peruviana]